MTNTKTQTTRGDGNGDLKASLLRSRNPGDWKKVPVAERVCELCNDKISDKTFKVVKSFLLTDHGPICFECWDSEVSDYEQFEIFKLYAKAKVIEDNWEARMICVLQF